MPSDTNEIKVSLSAHSDKYASESLEFSFSKKVNFLFGKNGTGKTTLVNEIAVQCEDDYSVHVFKDFEGVAVNERLDAVALGTNNAQIQQQIDAIDGEISKIKTDVSQPDDDTENSYTKAAVAKRQRDDQEVKINRFYTQSASQIKGLTNPQVSSPSYDKNAFKSEIAFAVKLTNDEIAIHKNTIRADKKPSLNLVTLPTIDLEAYLESTNQVLAASVTQSTVIVELEGNPQKQQFAKNGMDIHERVANEKCAFCGNVVTENRWIELANHFNHQVKKLEERIKTGIELLERGLNQLEAIKLAEESHYYSKYADRVKLVNDNIKLRKADYVAYLTSMKVALENKKSNLFAPSDLLMLETPHDFSSTQTDYTSLIADNNLFSQNLTNEVTKAKNALRYNEIEKKLDVFNYSGELAIFNTVDDLSNKAQEALSIRRNDLNTKQQERIDIIAQTKDEKTIALKINELLKSMGAVSFELELVDDDDEQQKGQYQILGHDGDIRPVTALSKGEKNIVAFLYFIFDLQRAGGNAKPKIIVLDDPMTSNDDTMQYIMINEIQKLYRDLKEGNYFILLTHNAHFYLNARPNTGKMYKIKEGGEEKEISFYEKYGVFHLLSNGKRSTITPINKGKNDFGTSYETLWKELVFLHDTTDATPDIMLNPCRKICETYMHFTRKGVDKFYGENTSAKKLFDVNQHSIDDFEAEMNGKTKPEIKNILKQLFRQNEAEDHFNSYWKASQ